MKIFILILLLLVGNATTIKEYKNKLENAKSPQEKVSYHTKLAELYFEKKNFVEAVNHFQILDTQYITEINLNKIFQRHYDSLSNWKINFTKDIGFFTSFTDITKAYETFIQIAPFNVLTPKAALDLAELYTLDEEYAKASIVYERITEKYLHRESQSKAHYKLADLCFNKFKGSGENLQYIRKASENIHKCIKLRPDEKTLTKAKKLSKKIATWYAEKLYKKAVFYLNETDFKERYFPFYPHQQTHRRVNASKRYLNQIIKNFSHTETKIKAQKLLDRLTKSPLPVANSKKEEKPEVEKIENPYKYTKPNDNNNLLLPLEQ